MGSLIPSFNFNHVFIAPWINYPDVTFPIVLMAFLVSASCGLVGVYLILRKMALVGDAVSHSLLPGIALGFLIAGVRDSVWIFTGAIFLGLITVVLIEFINQSGRIKSDAAIGIVFSSLFAIGVIIIALFADHIDLDLECVLYGEIGFIPLMEPISVLGVNVMPAPIMIMFLVFIKILVLVKLFYKQLLVSSFDSELAQCLGINPRVYQYGLVLVLSLVIVSAFKSVGAILVVAMLLFPGATALILSNSLKKVLALTIVLSLIYAVGGLHLATWLDASIAGSMTVVAFMVFLFVWGATGVQKKRARSVELADS